MTRGQQEPSIDEILAECEKALLEGAEELGLTVQEDAIDAWKGHYRERFLHALGRHKKWEEDKGEILGRHLGYLLGCAKALANAAHADVVNAKRAKQASELTDCNRPHVLDAWCTPVPDPPADRPRS